VANILIIDDDKGTGSAISFVVKEIGHEASCVCTLLEGLKKVMCEAVDLVFLDVRLPDGNGLDVLPKILEASDPPEVIIITGMMDPNGAELAINSGAWDYIQKPFSAHEMMLHIARALQYRDEKKRKLPFALKREGIVGESPQTMGCLDIVAKAATSEASVLITGETGTGKELFARAIHQNSQRHQKSFVVVDCSALPETLAESILFGHERGAFTGADRSSEGMVKQADGGTLFLDEVGELPLCLQKNFLRVLQEHRFRPIGAKQELESRFRLVAATNRDLNQMVRDGQFREDLLFRLRSISIDLPPLRERPRDIKQLAMHYVARLCEHYGMEVKGFSPEFFNALLSYRWPGNVRELRNTLEGILLTTAQHSSILLPNHLPNHIRIEVARSLLKDSLPAKTSRSETTGFAPSGAFPRLSVFLENNKRQYLQNLMSYTGWDVAEACRVSGMSRSSLYDSLKKLKISYPE